jgi:putative flippase GtrA
MILFAATTEAVRISRFGIVGILNTLLDFAIFNTLSSKKIGLGKLTSNTISTTIAMICSFLLNRNFVFSGHGNPLIQAILFLGITAVGLYVLQNGVIYLFTKVWSWPGNMVVRLIDSLNLRLDKDFVLKNSAKVIGTLVSLIWNYLLYSKVVFRAYS